MKTDLYTAQVRAVGSSGLAHRTAAGFVVVTSSDGDDMIAMIDTKQNESDLIDQIVAKAQNDGPESFAMLFTAGGDLYLIAAGDTTVVITSASAQQSMSPVAGQVLVHPISAGLNETAATIRLKTQPATATIVAGVNLEAGTVEADWVEVAVGGAELSVPEPASETTRAAASDLTSEADSTPDAEPEPPAAASDPTPEAEPEPPAAASDPTPEAEPEPPAAASDPTPEAEPEPAPVAEEAPAESAIEPEAIEPAPTPEPAPEPAPEPVAPEPATAPEIAIAPVAAPEPEVEAPAQPVQTAAEPDAAVPVEPPEQAAGPAQVGPVMVLGVACSQGHHNHPDAVYCSQCGTKMGVHHTTVLLNGPRPPLGVLVVDDGTTYSLNENLVIGREPTSHEEVLAGTASPMILTDDTLSLSRKHARIFLDDWAVFVQDLNSSNGTYLSRAGQAEAWTKVDPAASMSLEPGDRLRVGGRIIQVELHHVR